jgi:hypothetical protein
MPESLNPTAAIMGAGLNEAVLIPTAVFLAGKFHGFVVGQQ